MTIYEITTICSSICSILLLIAIVIACRKHKKLKDEMNVLRTDNLEVRAQLLHQINDNCNQAEEIRDLRHDNDVCIKLYRDAENAVYEAINKIENAKTRCKIAIEIKHDLLDWASKQEAGKADIVIKPRNEAPHI